MAGEIVRYKSGLYIKPVVDEVKKALNLGFDAVFTSPSREVALKARELGLLYAPLIWIPKTSDLSLGVVNAWGEVKLFAFNNSGCIMNPALMENILSRIERVVDETDADAIILDALRFPSPHDMEWLFTCFCRYCRDFMKSLNINSEELAENVRRAARNIHLYPHLNPVEFNALQTLFYVRQRAVEHALTLIGDLTGKLGIKLWGAVFPPSLAWMVGQNYFILNRFLDQVQVMLYHSGRGAACLNHELASLVKLISSLSSIGVEDSLKVLSYLTGFEVGFNLDRLERELPLNIVMEEFLRAKKMFLGKAVPIFWLDERFESILRQMEGLFEVIAVFKPRGS